MPASHITHNNRTSCNLVAWYRARPICTTTIYWYFRTCIGRLTTTHNCLASCQISNHATSSHLPSEPLSYGCSEGHKQLYRQTSRPVWACYDQLRYYSLPHHNNYQIRSSESTHAVTMLIIHGKLLIMPKYSHVDLDITLSKPNHDTCKPDKSLIQYVLRYGKDNIQIHVPTCAKSVASFSGPAQLSFAISTEKCGEPGIFSHVSMTIRKWRKFSEQTGCVSSIVQPTTRSMLGVYDNHPPLARYVW